MIAVVKRHTCNLNLTFEHVTSPPLYKLSPFACIVLSENSNHPLHGAQYGPMDDDGPSSVVSILPVTCHISWFYREQPNRLFSLHTDAEHLPIFSSQVCIKFLTSQKQECLEHCPRWETVFIKGFIYNPWCSRASRLNGMWTCSLGNSPHKGQVKAEGQLEVQLDGCTLVVTANCIFDFNINLQQHTEKPTRTFRQNTTC